MAVWPSLYDAVIDSTYLRFYCCCELHTHTLIAKEEGWSRYVVLPAFLKRKFEIDA